MCNIKFTILNILNCWPVLSVFTLLSGNLYNSLILQHWESLPIKKLLFLPVSGSWQLPFCLLCLWIQRPSFPCISGVTQNLLFCVWLISLHTRSSGFIHVASVRISSSCPCFFFCLRLIYLAGEGQRKREREKIKQTLHQGQSPAWVQVQTGSKIKGQALNWPCHPGAQHFLPVEGRLICHHLHKPCHIYPFLHRWVLGLLLHLDYCERCFCDVHVRYLFRILLSVFWIHTQKRNCWVT